jgi:hypothetical protein
MEITAMLEIFHWHAYAACGTTADTRAPQIGKRRAALLRPRRGLSMRSPFPFA